MSHKSPSTVQCEGVTERGRERQQPTPVFVNQSKLQIFNPSEDGCIDGATLFVPPHITSDSGTGCNRLSAFPVLPAEGALGADALLQRPRADSGFRALEPGLVKIYDAVVRVGVPNYRGARVPVPSALNIPAWRQAEHLLDDQSLVDCLEFGFPVGFMGNTPPATSIQNHTSARANPSHILDYLATEKGHDTMVGPFHAPPFSPWFRTNPAMTRPKRDSDKLRVILDVSYPQECSVNSHVPCGSLDGADFKLRLPTPSDLAALVRRLGKGCLMYKVDLSRAYRQLRSDPFDWPLLGIEWDDQFYMDTAVPFGLRHGASACQRTTEAVVTLARIRHEAMAYPYIDDTAGAALPDRAMVHYRGLLGTMDELGLEAAPQKCEPPSTRMTWVGVTLDSLLMTMSIDVERVREAAELCDQFLASSVTTLKSMQCFMGKLFHVAKCSPPARRFTSRLQSTEVVTTANHRAVIYGCQVVQGFSSTI